ALRRPAHLRSVPPRRASDLKLHFVSSICSMQERNTPFTLLGYHGADLFCDREHETQQLIDYAKNGVHVTLFSLRKMGKTGLIHRSEEHTSELQSRENLVCRL